MSEIPTQNSKDEIEQTLKVMKEGNTEQQIKATKQLGDLLRQAENRPIVIELGGVEILVPLLIEDVEIDFSCQIIRSLSNLIFDSPDNITKIVKFEGVFKRIHDFIKQDKSLELKRNTIAAVANFAHESGFIFLLTF